MKLGSLFSGSGGFELAGMLNGIEPVWCSEIEPFCVRVEALRFPNCKQIGSVTDIDGGAIEPVDVITFGSPCQDLSIAGKQAGIHDGERSSLFFEAIRIIKEMRNATANVFPRFAVWENVPGAFSSNKGEDFRAVLEAFREISDRGGIMYLNLRKENGITREPSWEMVGALPGVCTTLNFGESPNVARESTLSRILQENVPEKYFLSAKACAGILRRAERRGKELPEILKEALEEVISLSSASKETL